MATHIDYEFNDRINSLVNKLLYKADIDPHTTNRFELEAAKLLIKSYEKEQAETEPVTIRM